MINLNISNIFKLAKITDAKFKEEVHPHGPYDFTIDAVVGGLEKLKGD